MIALMRCMFSRRLMISLVILWVPMCSVLAQSANEPEIAKATEAIIEQTNNLRKDNGLNPVKANEKLSATAEYFASFMADSGKYGHEADGHLPSDRATKHGYQYALINENIAWQSNSEGFTTEKLAEGFEKGWENSPEHRKNMLDPDVLEIGVAIAKASDGKYYAVQMFGRPKTAATSFSIQNRSRATIQYSIDGQSYDLKPNYTRQHTVGRPPELEITLPGEKEPKSINPVNGAEYVIRPTGDGKLEISGPKAKSTTHPATTQAAAHT
jgi:uncharacterized protein YkwD